MDENNFSLPEILPAYDDGIFKAIFTRPESEPARKHMPTSAAQFSL
jgi:hypothetical protein